MHPALDRLYGVSHMVKPHLRLGELPKTRDAYRDVITLALPSVIEMVLTSLIGSIDTMMVGTLGHEAIAAVGLVGQPRMILLAIFFAMNIGVTAVVARRKGEGRQADANQALRNAILMISGLSILLMVPALIFAKEFMIFAGASEANAAEIKALADSTAYFRILTYALPLNALTMCINAAQRGVGNTRITMFVNIASNIVNVIFNYLLIGGNFGFPALGVEGAAIATVLGFSVGFVMSLLSVTRKRRVGVGFLHLSLRDDWRLSKEAMEAIGKVGGNAMLEQVAMRIGFFLYARMVRSLGLDAFASHQVCMQFLNISFTFGDGIGIAGTSLVGQMMGKNRPDLSQMYGKVSQRMALTVSIVLMSFVMIFRYPLVGLFIDGAKEPQVMAMAAQVMIIVGLFQPFQTSNVVISGCLRGAGDTKAIAIIMMICILIIRPTLTYISINFLGLGLIGAWSSSLVDMIVRLTFVYTRFSRGKWMQIKI